MEVFLAGLAIAGTLAGVGIGWWLDRKTRSEERDANERIDLRNAASDVLGRAKLTLGAASPLQYAAFASDAMRDEIEKRRSEADSIRPELAILSIRWPDAEFELSAISEFLAFVPNRLHLLVQQSLAHKDISKLVDDLKNDHSAAVGALDRAVAKLHPDRMSPGSKGT